MTISRRQILAGFSSIGAAALIGCGPRSDQGRKDADVIVIGAGLSGLHAALMLEAAGLSVIVVEAADRIGGRMMTLDHLPGAPEAGGQQVGQTYARVRARAAEAGLEFAPFPPNGYGQVLALGDDLIAAEDWADHPANGLPEAWRSIPPTRLFFSLAARANPFEDVYAWMDEAAAASDIAARDWLVGQGANEEALRLMEVALNARDLSTYSMLNLFRSLAIYAQERGLGGSERLTGGSQRLPEAMAATLAGDVRLNSAVGAIEADEGGAMAQMQDGARLRSDFIVSSLPFPVLRGLAVDAPFSPRQRDAVGEMAYTPIVQLHLEAETPWWERDGLPPEMWTDSALERVFAQRAADGAPTGNLVCWLDGLGGLSADAMADAELQAMAQSELARLRPASEGRVRLRHVQRWTASNALAGGAYMHYQPGQAPAWGGKISDPAGRLHLAGEHMGELHTGMEAAMEAGERAALQILEAAGA